MSDALHFDTDLIRRYDTNGPRYTSYPTAPQFRSDFGEADYQTQIERSNAAGGPLSLYLHLPFCPSPCFYCACTRLITRQPAVVQTYVEHLLREIALQGPRFDNSRTVEQLAWGGGTPTYLSNTQMRAVMMALKRHFRLSDNPDREFTVEIDPRTVDAESIKLLAELGFNRASLGVQDFDANVQQAVNRIQPQTMVAEVLEQLRAADFCSVNFDLIYGLPRQTPAGFAVTLDAVCTMRPGRVALYSYAHLPERFKGQHQIRAADLPSAAVKLTLLEQAATRLGQAGYVYIGMDHFALPSDELVFAQAQGNLQRNFQGYSTHRNCDLVGMGMSAISSLAGSYSQHEKALDAYYSAIDHKRLPVARGVRLDADDLLRRDVIQTLMCNPRLDVKAIESAHEIDFPSYFATELKALEPLAADGLVHLEDTGIEITARGRLLLRVIAMTFDAYLQPQNGAMPYSKVI